jgi:NTP pyrophosphatase (non-canonical NTP hydrolase)
MLIPEIRSDRQALVDRLLVNRFGETVAHDVKERALRLLEEALEVAQACGVHKMQVERLTHYTFGREVGELSDEIGGVSTTLLSLCQATNHFAESEEINGIQKFSEIDVRSIRAKWLRKQHVGITAFDKTPSDFPA